MSDKEKNITIHSKDPEVLKKAKAKAASEDRTFSAYVVRLIKKDLGLIK